MNPDGCWRTASEAAALASVPVLNAGRSATMKQSIGDVNLTETEYPFRQPALDVLSQAVSNVRVMNRMTCSTARSLILLVWPMIPEFSRYYRSVSLGLCLSPWHILLTGLGSGFHPSTAGPGRVRFRLDDLLHAVII
jgi:hypothetical protein